MTGKEKLALALNHQEGPLAFDIGGMPTTGIHCIVHEKLREFYGLKKQPVRILEPVQMLGMLEEDLKECLGIDTHPMWSNSSMFGFEVEDKWKEWRTPWGQDVLVPEEFVTDTNQKGDTLIYPGADRTCEPTGRMPKGGYFFDNIERTPIWDEEDFRLEDNLEEFTPVSEKNLNWLHKQADKNKDSGYIIMGNLGGTAFGDAALIPGPMLKHPKGLRRLEDWYMAMITNQDVLHEIFSYQADVAIQNLEKIYEVIGDTIQVAYMCGADFGTQRGPLCSTEIFHNVYAPYYKKVNEWVHSHTSWKTFKHSCGGIAPLIPEIIEAGFDCLNPVQWTADGMDRKTLKQEFGRHLTFWGGGIDTQHLLPEGTPQQVFDQALECCRILGAGGGYVFNTIHNIVPGVPAENVDALARAVRKYNQG